MNYRSDIDGLRAVAVLAVVVYHLNSGLLPGGFFGVDIFFVISGYLITGIIVKEMGAGAFRISNFYVRRIRRILPAFLCMIAATLLVSSVILLPDTLKVTSSSALAAMGSVSNVFFWVQSSDYFAVSAAEMPLLHTWSLGVEEQFYLVAPLALILASKIRVRNAAFLACVVALCLSLAACVYLSYRAPMANFYLLPGRAWELLAGAVLSFSVFPTFGRRSFREVEAWLGAALVMGSLLLYSSQIALPGVAAIVPVLGTALVIHSASGRGAATSLASLLSVTPMRFVGWISYSLYLWHWPVIVLFDYFFIEVTWFQYVAMLVVMFGLAVASWWFVERPFRRPASARRWVTFATAGVASLFVAVPAIGLVASDGWRTRVPDEILTFSEKETHQGPYRECGGAYRQHLSASMLCTLGAPSQPPTILVLGDSHAEAIAAAVFEAGADVGRAGTQITDTGYRPVLGFRKMGEEKKYEVLNQMVTDILDGSPSLRTVVIALYWRQATLVDRYLDADGQIVDGRQALRDGLGALARRYPDKQFLVLSSPPNSTSFGAEAAARARWYGRADFVPSMSAPEFRGVQSFYRDVLADLSRLPNVQTFDLSSRLCNDSLCVGSTEDGQIAFTDDNHLSWVAAKGYEPEFISYLEQH